MTTSQPLVRLGGAAGFAAAVLYLTSFAAGLADAPSSSAAGTVVLTWATEHRSGLLTALILNLAAWLVLVPLFALGLRERLTGTAGTLAVAAAFLTVALIGIVLIFLAMLVFRSQNLAPGTATTLADGAQLATLASAWPTVLLMGTVLAARPPRAVAILAGVALVTHLLAGVSVAHSGTFSPTGTFAELAPLCFTAWMTAASLWMVRRPVAVAAAAVPA
jgi:hypothetical protein